MGSREPAAAEGSGGAGHLPRPGLSREAEYRGRSCCTALNKGLCPWHGVGGREESCQWGPGRGGTPTLQLHAHAALVVAHTESHSGTRVPTLAPRDGGSAHGHRAHAGTPGWRVSTWASCPHRNPSPSLWGSAHRRRAHPRMGDQHTGTVPTQPPAPRCGGQHTGTVPTLGWGVSTRAPCPR